MTDELRLLLGTDRIAESLESVDSAEVAALFKWLESRKRTPACIEVWWDDELPTSH